MIIKKIILWNSSFSNGHFIAVGAENSNSKDIVGIMAHVPFVGGRHSIKQKSPKDIFFADIYEIYDMCFSFEGSAIYSPVIGKSGTFVAMNTEESCDEWSALIANGITRKNETAFFFLLKMMLYNPIENAHKIQTPILVLPGRYNSLMSIKTIQHCSSKISNMWFPNYWM